MIHITISTMNDNPIINGNSIISSKIVNISNKNKRGTEDDHNSHDYIIRIGSRSSCILNTTKTNSC